MIEPSTCRSAFLLLYMIFFSGVIARIVRRGESRNPVKNFAAPSSIGLNFFDSAG